MGKEQIIAKGKYAYEQPEEIIGVEHYLFIRDTDGKKRLLLRFNNKRNERCSKFAFVLYKLDSKGNVLGQERFESADREYLEREVFSFDHKITVDEKCTNFRVQMIYARYGHYTYAVENNDVFVSYSEKNLDSFGQVKSAAKAKPRKINGRSFDTPWFFAVLSLIILALVFAATGFLLNSYKEAEVDFSLGGVNYKFVDAEKKDDVIITGCAENYRSITIGTEIEGHKIVAIEKDAFKGNDSIVHLTIDGFNIDAGAFLACSKLTSVTIKNVSYVGDRAFEDCRRLESITINEGEAGQLLYLGKHAFADCGALLDVEINQTLVYGSEPDYFKGSRNVESLKLRNFAFTMENVPSYFVTRLNLLFGIDSVEKSTSKLKTLVIENMDYIPENFARGFKKLESVTIVNTEIKSVGNNAFMGCPALASVSTKGSYEVIGEGAFASTAITSIDLSKVHTLGNSAFLNATKLVEVKGFGNGGIDNIPVSTFEGCSSLSAFTINKNIKHIHASSFKNSGLTKLDIPEGVTFDAGVLRGCKKLTELSVYQLGSAGYVGMLFGASRDDSSSRISEYIPASLKKISLGIGTTINAHAFKGCSDVEVIDLPDGIVAIGESAFAGCESLLVMDIPADSTTLKYIGAGAFSGCKLLKELPLTSSLEYIGSGAFRGCNGIEALNIPFLGSTPDLNDGRESVSYLFDGSVPAMLKTITLLDTDLVRLPDGAFEGCDGATKIIIPASVTNVGADAFSGCSSLTVVKVMGTSTAEGADMSRVTSIGADAFDGCVALTSVKLCPEITSIGSRAFRDTGIKSMVIPEGIVHIGEYILRGCNSLATFSTPFLGSYKDRQEDMEYFFGYDVPASLKTVRVLSFANGEIGNRAFKNCTNVTSFILPNDVTAIGDEAFYGCAALASFDFSKITSVGKYAFAGCTLLRANGIGGLENIGAGAFSGCEAITECVLENAVEIGDDTFYGCVSITSVTLGNNLVTIGNRAFAKTGITSISLPNSLREIGSEAFYECASLTEVRIGQGVQVIGSRAFSGTGVSSISLPYTVTRIDSEAFSLTPITEIVIPRSVTSLGTGVLSGCESLVSVSFPITEDYYYGGFDFYNYYNSYAGIGGFLFNAQIPSSVRSITINSSSRNYITETMFNGASFVRSIEIDANITYIYDYAFSQCNELRYISLPDTVTPATVGTSVFDSCMRLYEISTSSSEGFFAPYVVEYNQSKAPTAEKDGYSFALYGSDWYLVDYPDTEELVLPDSFEFEGVPVSEYKIPQNLFFCKDKLTAVTISAGVKSIGANAFADCYNLKTVKSVDAGARLASLGESAFARCYALKTVILPSSVVGIGANAFMACSEMTEIALSRSLKRIEDGAFYACTKLNGIKLYENVSYIGENAFGACYSLYDVYNASGLNIVAGQTDHGRVARFAVVVHTDMEDELSVEIPIEGIGTFRRSNGQWLLIYGDNLERVTLGEFKYLDETVKSYRIAERAFAGNAGIVEVVIGNQVREIHEGAFYGCSSIKTVDMSQCKGLAALENSAFTECISLLTVKLPSSLKEIGDMAFYNCYRLKSIDMPTELVRIGESAFKNCDRLMSVKLCSKVESIGFEAFYGCTNLFEVYDLSDSIAVEKGSYENGYAGFYADTVFTNEKGALERKEQSGIKFIKAFDTWYLYDYDGSETGILSIPNIGASLVIMSYAFEEGEFAGAVLPTNLISVRYNAFGGMITLNQLYYAGSTEEWYDVEDMSSCTYFYHFYVYESCIHVGGSANYTYESWRYDENGQVTTELCPENESVIKEATCYQWGEMLYSCACKGCEFTRTESVMPIGHEFENGVCKNCKSKEVRVDGSSLGALIESGIITVDGFEYSEEKDGFKSQNIGYGTKATFTFTAQEEMTLSFTVEAFSQPYRDYIIITVGGVDYSACDGRNTSSYSGVLSKGDVVSVMFIMYGGDTAYEDCGVIKDIVMAEKTEQKSN